MYPCIKYVPVMPAVMLTRGLGTDAMEVSVIDMAVRPVRGDVGAAFADMFTVL